MEFDGKQISQEIDLVNQAISNKSERWKALRKFYRNEPSPVTPAVKGGISAHYGIIQPVIDTLTASVVNTITSESPHCVPMCFESDEAEELQGKVVQFFSEKDKLKYALKRVGPSAGYTNRGIIEVRWDEDEASFEYSVMEPNSFVCYPTWVENLSDAKFVGHKYYRRRTEIEELIKDKRYKDLPIQATEIEDTNQQLQASRNIPSATVSPMDESIELYRLLYKKDKKWWQLIIAPQTGSILREEEWTYNKLNYFTFGYKPQDTEDGAYPSQSVANDLQEYQLIANHLVSDALNGQRMGMFGMGTAKKGLDNNQAFLEYQPGAVVVGMDIDGMYFPSVNISSILPILERVLRQANEAARISDMARGQSSAGNKTATQSEHEAQGTKRAIDEYIESFGEGVVGIFEYMQVVLSKSYGKWSKKYGKALGLDEEEGARKYMGYPVLWSLAVASIGATPGAMFQLINHLTALAQDPEYKFDKYKIGQAILSYSERMGLLNADKFQYPEDPLELLQVLAEELALIGVDPNTVISATIAAIEMASQPGMGGVEGSPMQSGSMGGDTAVAGLPQAGIGGGGGDLGVDQSGVS